MGHDILFQTMSRAVGIDRGAYRGGKTLVLAAILVALQPHSRHKNGRIFHNCKFPVAIAFF